VNKKETNTKQIRNKDQEYKKKAGEENKDVVPNSIQLVLNPT
jgi:hypothetical protein